jgi:hypothetical protein
MEKIKNQSDLLKILKNDIKTSPQSKVVFLAGHFPLLYSQNNSTALEGISYWGHFSPFTLELACTVGEYAVACGKKVEFIFFIDDHAYEEITGLHPRERSKRRDNLYRLRSSANASLPEEYKKIFSKHGFSEKNVLRHNHNKAGRSDCLYFSEKILRASTKKIDNACAREYTEFIEDSKYFNKKTSYLVAFIPNRCKGHICDVALAHEVKNIHASHVFMETLMPTINRKELFETSRGVTYKKD